MSTRADGTTAVMTCLLMPLMIALSAGRRCSGRPSATGRQPPSPRQFVGENLERSGEARLVAHRERPPGIEGLERDTVVRGQEVSDLRTHDALDVFLADTRVRDRTG